jgi:D-alanyl-D-alanine carboxypeptidase (penicillin-binding protein 5/6)
MRGPDIAPEHTVGGAELAGQGVLTDRPTGVPAPPDIPHVSYVLADMGSAEVLAAKSPHALLYPASTLKTLTALVALPRLDPKQVVVATADDANAEGTRVGLMAGNPYSVDDLFNGMLMVSGNDAAYAIARAYGGKSQILADMNAAAARLGAWDTNAVDPSGLDADGQRTSAYDLALIGRAAMALPEFRRHAVLLQAQFPGGTDPTGKVVPPFQIQNHNPIIGSYAGTVGVKSGYTTKARNTFIAAVTRGGRTLLLAEMGSVVHQTEPTEALLDWGFAYAGRVGAVGTLVDPGAARPPEWSTSPAVTESAPATATDDPTLAIGVASTPSASPTPVESVVVAAAASAWSTLGDPPRAVLAAVVALVVAGLTWLMVRARRRRRRGAYER